MLWHNLYFGLTGIVEYSILYSLWLLFCFDVYEKDLQVSFFPTPRTLPIPDKNQKLDTWNLSGPDLPRQVSYPDSIG